MSDGELTIGVQYDPSTTSYNVYFLVKKESRQVLGERLGKLFPKEMNGKRRFVCATEIGRAHV